MLAGASGKDATGKSTWHAVVATDAVEAIHLYSLDISGAILGSVNSRGEGATAIIETAEAVYRLIVIPPREESV